MAYNEPLAERIKNQIYDFPGYSGRKMFGGIGFMFNGNMACGIYKEDMILRVGPDKHDSSLAEPHTDVFDITGRVMKGWKVVSKNGLDSDDDLWD